MYLALFHYIISLYLMLVYSFVNVKVWLIYSNVGIKSRQNFDKIVDEVSKHFSMLTRRCTSVDGHTHIQGAINRT